MHYSHIILYFSPEFDAKTTCIYKHGPSVRPSPTHLCSHFFTRSTLLTPNPSHSLTHNDIHAHTHTRVHTFSLAQPYSTHLCQLTSKQCLSVIAPGQTNTLHRGRSGETIDSQLIYQRFALQVLRRKEDKGEGQRKG